MKKLILVLRGLFLPIGFICGVSIDRYFFKGDKNFLIPLILTGIYTIWYLIDVFRKDK
jgi:uncharacterized membrane protein AbrB (regulator of aidB expression)